jgi:hypothetical protein
MAEERDFLTQKEDRERKGAFYTPSMWAELARAYIARAFGERWQKDYTIWDCACGTGRLAEGIDDRSALYLSTLDYEDVEYVRANVRRGDSVFQFDFLNDGLDKLPQTLRKTIEKTPERILIFINPPYAEAGNAFKIMGTGENKTNVKKSAVADWAKERGLGAAANELFCQFFLRIKRDIPKAKVGTFSTPKYINGQNFKTFREFWTAKFKAGFIVPAWTFDGVVGKFPVSFCCWDLDSLQNISEIIADVFDERGRPLGKKKLRIAELS